MRLNFPGDNPMHSFRRRSRIVENYKRKEIVTDGIGHRPSILRDHFGKKIGDYGKRRSQTQFSDFSAVAQQQIHAYHLAHNIIAKDRHAVPKETVYHAVSLLRRMSPKISPKGHSRELLTLGEENRIELSKLNPAHCAQFVTEVKQIMREQNSNKSKQKIRLRDIATFWDPAQRKAFIQFAQKKIVWVHIAQKLNVSVNHVLELHAMVKGASIEDYERSLVDLQNLADSCKKQIKKRKGIVPMELMEKFLAEYKVFKQQLIE